MLDLIAFAFAVAAEQRRNTVCLLPTTPFFFFFYHFLPFPHCFALNLPWAFERRVSG